MANTLTEVLPKLLAEGLMALRQQAIMPRLINRGYESLAAERGSIVNVPISSAIVPIVVAPAAVPPSTADIAPTSVPIALDQWYEAPFYLTDKDLKDAMTGVIPMQASEAIKGLINNVDTFILGKYKKIYGIAATAAADTAFTANPFASSPSEYTNARAILNKQLAPPDDRRVVLNPDTEGNALNLQAFAFWQNAGSTDVITRGQIGTKLGADWYMDQLIPTHTTGTLSDGTSHKCLLNGAVSAGAATMNVDSTTLTGTIVPGDIFVVTTAANDLQTYVVTNASTLTASGNAITGVTFAPVAQKAWADNSVIKFYNSHSVNLAFHRDAFAFASRPLLDIDTPGALVRSAVDEISGLVLRLEITREHKRTRFSYDMLYGGELVRAELACRIAGIPT
jgi:hypothetical protein